MPSKGGGRNLNRNEVSEFFGVSTNTVDAWVRANCPYVQKGGRGRSWIFNSADLHQWRIQIATGGKNTDPDDEERSGLVSKEEAEKRTANARMIREEIETAHLVGAVIEIDLVDQVFGKQVDKVRARLLSIPAKAARQLIGVDDYQEAKDTLERAIFNALQELSGFNPEEPRKPN